MAAPRTLIAPADAGRASPALVARAAAIAHGAFVACLAAYLAIALGYALTTPPWNNPDEPAHYNFVADVAATHQLPVMEPGDWNQALLNRLIASQFTVRAPLDSIRYESWQPPLYYLLALPVYGAEPGQAARLRGLREWDVVLGGITLVLAYAAALELFVRAPLPSLAGWSPGARSALAVAVPAVMAGIPMFTATAASVDNDVLANLMGAALILVLLRAARALPSWRGQLGLGVLLGLSLLTKLTLGAFVVLVPLAFAAATRRARMPWRTALRPTVAVFAIALLVMVPWLIREGLTYGWTDLLAQARHDQVVVGQPRAQLSPAYLWHWTSVSFQSFWAQFGWMTIVAPAKLHAIWLAFTAIGAAGLALLARRWIADPQRDARPVLLVAAFLAALAPDLYHNLSFDQAQGRFVFVALVPICALLVLGWARLTPARARPWLVPALAAGLVLLNVYTLVRVVIPAWIA